MDRTKGDCAPEPRFNRGEVGITCPHGRKFIGLCQDVTEGFDL